MKFHVGLSTDRVDRGDEFVSAEAIAEVARAAEAARAQPAVIVIQRNELEEPGIRPPLPSS